MSKSFERGSKNGYIVGMGLSRSSGTDLLQRNKETAKEPPRYTCMLHNDHFTTREFVVYVLIAVFQLSDAEAQKKMLEVHKQGKGSVGNFSYDVARSKAMKTEKLARDNEFPLKCTVETI